jgi:hypothetical protein
MDTNWRVLLTADPLDKDQLEADVWYGEEHWAELIERDHVIQFFHRQAGEPWAFKFEDVLIILNILAKDNIEETVSVSAR